MAWETNLGEKCALRQKRWKRPKGGFGRINRFRRTLITSHLKARSSRQPRLDISHKSQILSFPSPPRILRQKRRKGQKGLAARRRVTQPQVLKRPKIGLRGLLSGRSIGGSAGGLGQRQRESP